MAEVCCALMSPDQRSLRFCACSVSLPQNSQFFESMAFLINEGYFNHFLEASNARLSLKDVKVIDKPLQCTKKKNLQKKEIY